MILHFSCLYPASNESCSYVLMSKKTCSYVFMSLCDFEILSMYIAYGYRVATEIHNELTVA